MSRDRPIAAAYEAQPVIEAMILAFERDDVDGVVLSVPDVISILNCHFSTRPSRHAVSEAFDEGSRLGLWTLVGRQGEQNHIEINRITVQLFAEALRSQSDSVLHILDKVGGDQLKVELTQARRKAEQDLGDDPALGKLTVLLKRLDHNQVFQRGLAATRNNSGPARVASQRSPSAGIDWTKSGAIAAWMAIPLTVIGVVAAIIALVR